MNVIRPRSKRLIHLKLNCGLSTHEMSAILKLEIIDCILPCRVLNCIDVSFDFSVVVLLTLRVTLYHNILLFFDAFESDELVLGCVLQLLNFA